MPSPRSTFVAGMLSLLAGCPADPAADTGTDPTTTTTDPSGSASTGSESGRTESTTTSGADTSTGGPTSGTSSSEASAETSVADPVSVTLTLGHTHSCVLAQDGQMKCWGSNFSGELGQGDTVAIGDDETPAAIPAIDLGGVAVQASAGSGYTCAVLEGGALRCWGFGGYGNLGYGNSDSIGDDETPAMAGDVDVGGVVVQVAAGEGHTCARLEGGAVRCWGGASNGQLGYGNVDVIGDDETPASAGDVPLGGTAVWISAGRTHTCAVLDTGSVRCWGNGFAGELGYGNLDDVGDDETPASVGDVQLGMMAVDGDIAYSHSCARSAAGAVRCWGDSQNGALGYGNVAIIGDDEVPSVAGDVDTGGSVAQLALGYNGYTCARFDAGNLRCWGNNFFGALGYGHMMNLGDDELPSSIGDVDVGGVVTDVAAGDNHTCAVLDDGAVRCWGNGDAGKLGYGNTISIGDDETPATAGDVAVW